MSSKIYFMKIRLLIILTIVCIKMYAQNLQDFQPINFQEAGLALMTCEESNCSEDQINVLFEKYLKLKPTSNHLCYTILKVRKLHNMSNAKMVKDLGFNYYAAPKKVRLALEDKNIIPEIKSLLISN